MSQSSSSRSNRRLVWIAAAAILLIAGAVALIFQPSRERDEIGIQQPAATAASPPETVESNEPKVGVTPTIADSPGDSEGQGLDHITKEVIADAERMIPHKPHPWRSKLVENMSSETIEQTIENFANFDDLSLAETTIPGMRIAPDHGLFQAICVTRLNRVRRVLEYGREDPETVIPLLRKRLLYVIDGFQGARREFDKLVDKGYWAPGTWSSSEPHEVTIRQTGAAATIYLLTELADYEALPIIARMCKEEIEGPTNPAPYEYAVYAIYELLKVHPRDGLTADQLNLLESCIEAGKELRPPREIEVTPWKDMYAEHDPRRTMMGMDLGTDRHHKIKMRVWDLNFTDGNRLRGREEPLFKKADEFLTAVYGSNG
ncbi:MAG TPA: hypothetical protein VMX13_00945 [Sedimentisphaerales bacterium]|nr:hypothetical protein [Sedimentisphaerales bacterium]